MRSFDECVGETMSVDFTSLSPATTVARASAPTWPAVAAAAAMVAALALVLPGVSALTLAVTGYALGALLVPAFTVVSRFRRRAAAQNPFFIPNRLVER